MVVTFSEGQRKARKRHRCFHCCRDIVPGETYGFQTNKYDYVYTIAWHLDCDALAKECRDLMDDPWDDEGWPGLREMWCDSGEYYHECDGWRGFYPHVVARLSHEDARLMAEAADALAEAQARIDQLEAWGNRQNEVIDNAVAERTEELRSELGHMAELLIEALEARTPTSPE